MLPSPFVFGDLLGLVVVPPEELLEVHDWCLQVIEKETAWHAKLAGRNDGN